MSFIFPKNILLILGDIFIAIVSVYAGIHLRLLSSADILQDYLMLRDV